MLKSCEDVLFILAPYIQTSVAERPVAVCSSILCLAEENCSSKWSTLNRSHYTKDIKVDVGALLKSLGTFVFLLFCGSTYCSSSWSVHVFILNFFAFLLQQLRRKHVKVFCTGSKRHRLSWRSYRTIKNSRPLVLFLCVWSHCEGVHGDEWAGSQAVCGRIRRHETSQPWNREAVSFMRHRERGISPFNAAFFL